jgi:hypothetical protein
VSTPHHPISSDLTDALDAALARLPEPLADDTARAGVRAIARRLPSVMTSGPLGLEIRLAGTPVIDVFAAAIPGDVSFTALTHSLRAGGWADDARAADVADVLDRWTRREGALPAVARYLLVEADAPDRAAGADARVPVPSIFLAPRGANDRRLPDAPPNAVQRLVDASTIAAAELSGVWPDPATGSALAAVVDAIPQGGEVFAIGAMLSRTSGSSMRVAIRRLDPAGMHAVLCAAGLPRQAHVIAARAQQSCAPQQDIAFEVGPGAEDRVGLELSPLHDWRAARTDGWPELLDEMVRTGVADAERTDVVLSLIDPIADPGPLWGLAHVKVAANESGMLPVSKLYVGLLHRGAR